MGDLSGDCLEQDREHGDVIKCLASESESYVKKFNSLEKNVNCIPVILSCDLPLTDIPHHNKKIAVVWHYKETLS